MEIPWALTSATQHFPQGFYLRVTQEGIKFPGFKLI